MLASTRMRVLARILESMVLELEDVQGERPRELLLRCLNGQEGVIQRATGRCHGSCMVRLSPEARGGKE